MNFKLIIMWLVCSPVMAGEIPADKAAHFGVSYGIAMTSAIVCKNMLKARQSYDGRLPSSSPSNSNEMRDELEELEESIQSRWMCPIAGALLGIIPGIVRESRGDYWDPEDMKANFYGVTSAALISIAIDF